MTTPQHDEADITFTVNTGYLNRIIGDAKLFASRDDTLPMLNQVKLDGDGDGNLVAGATNRFVVGMSRCDYAGPAFDASILLEDLVVLQKMLGLKRMANYPATVTITKGYFNVALESFMSIRVPRELASHPGWRHLIPAELDHETKIQPDMSFDFGYLGLFKKVGGGNYGTPMLFRQEGAKPAVVTVGPDFLGLLMPIRMQKLLAVPSWAR